MPNYLRNWNDRTIIVRPTKWNGAEELPPFDCLDITAEIERISDTLFPIDECYGIPPLFSDGLGGNWDRSDGTNLIEPILRQNPDAYRSKPFCRTHKENPRMSNPLFGCCVVATEALWLLSQVAVYPPNPLEVWKVKDAEGIWHWYLHHQVEDSHHFYDATRAQFHSWGIAAPDYPSGKKTALMGWKASPSKRTLDLCETIAPSSIRYRTTDDSYKPPSTPGTLESFLDC